MRRPSQINIDGEVYRYLKDNIYINQRLGGKIRAIAAASYLGDWAIEVGHIMECGVRARNGKFILAPAQPRPRVEHFNNCIREGSVCFSDLDEPVDSMIFVF